MATDIDAFETALKRKTGRNGVIATVLMGVLLLPLTAWRIYRGVSAVQRLSSRRSSPVANELITVTRPELFNRLGSAGHAFLHDVAVIDSLASIYGTQGIPPEALEHLRTSFAQAKASAERLPGLEPTDSQELAEVGAQVAQLRP